MTAVYGGYHRRHGTDVGHPGHADRPARPHGATRRAAPRGSRARRVRRCDLALDDHAADHPRPPARMGRSGTGERQDRQRSPVRDDRPRLRPGDREQPLHDDRSRESPTRDRLDMDRDRVPADGCQPRGEAPPAQPRIRDARRRAGRVQGACPERPVANGPARDRRHVRGGPPPPHDHAGRVDPRFRVLQRHRARMAGGQGSARGAARRDDRRAPRRSSARSGPSTTTRPASRSGS